SRTHRSVFVGFALGFEGAFSTATPADVRAGNDNPGRLIDEGVSAAAGEFASPMHWQIRRISVELGDVSSLMDEWVPGRCPSNLSSSVRSDSSGCNTMPSSAPKKWENFGRLRLESFASAIDCL